MTDINIESVIGWTRENRIRGGEKMKLSKKLPLLNSHSYWLVAGAPGSGKTTLTDQLFILDMIDTNTYWIYHNMERSMKHKIFKWLSYYIAKYEGVFWSYDTISQNRDRSFDFGEKEEEILRNYIDFIKRKIFDHCTVKVGRKTPTQIISETSTAQRKAKQAGYHNIIHVTDHIGKIKGNDAYSTIGEYSNGMGDLRDRTGLIVADICQVGVRKMNDAYRRKNFGAEILPSDIYGGDIPYQNCDVMLGVLDPYSMAMENYRGYDLNKMKILEDDCRYRAVRVMKSTYNMKSLVDTVLIGEVSQFKEIEKSSLFSYENLEIKSSGSWQQQ